jgi:hypothetical protein
MCMEGGRQSSGLSNLQLLRICLRDTGVSCSCYQRLRVLLVRTSFRVGRQSFLAVGR